MSKNTYPEGPVPTIGGTGLQPYAYRMFLASVRAAAGTFPR
jgi:hypothetical protein